jgi:hypothetical protein
MKHGFSRSGSVWLLSAAVPRTGCPTADPAHINAERILKRADGRTKVSYLLDMAKAVALDKVGEERAAEELARRHLS